jgi:valacyclovir hydrolase
MAEFIHGSSSLYYEETGAGDPIVLLPGITDSIAMYGRLRAALSRTYRVIGIDLPGSGKSGPQPRNYTPTYYEDDANAIADLVSSRTDVPAHFVGHSDGGEVVLLIAALFPDMVRSVFTWGATGAVDESHRGVVAWFANAVDDLSPETADFRAHLIEGYGEDNARAMMQSFARAVTSIIDAGGDISRSKAHQIVSPALLIAGEHDALASKALVDKVAERVPKAEVVELKGAGHLLHDTHAEWFERKLTEWLAAH